MIYSITLEVDCDEEEIIGIKEELAEVVPCTITGVEMITEERRHNASNKSRNDSSNT